MTKHKLILPDEWISLILYGQKRQIRIPFTEANCKIEGPAASVEKDGAGTGYIAWWPHGATAEETAKLYPGEEGMKPPYNIGDQLLLPETFYDNGGSICYRSSYNINTSKYINWQPPEKMKDTDIQCVVTVTNIRPERIQSISFDDWIEDFCPNWKEQELARSNFVGKDNQFRYCRKFWDETTNDHGSWNKNIWVWAIKVSK